MNIASHPENSPLGSATPDVGRPPRRLFLLWLVGLLTAAAGLLAGVPLVRWLLAKTRRPSDWTSIGPVEDFPLGETQLVELADRLRQSGNPREAAGSFFVRREPPADAGPSRFLVLANFCTHAGCAVEWQAEADEFHCPCHGGVFHADGSRASGRPPRGLYRVAWRVRDGQLQIRPIDFAALGLAGSDP